MKPRNPTEHHLAAYLLGRLSAEEELAVEERYLGDKEYLDQLEALEDELIDAYVQHRLTGSDRACFETHFLRSPGRRERVLFAESWWSFVSKRHSEKRNQRFGAVTAFFGAARPPAAGVLVPLAASALLLVVTSYLLIRSNDFRSDLAQVRAELSEFQQRAQELEKELAQERADRERLAEDLSSLQTDSNGPRLQTQARNLDAGPFDLIAGLTRGEQNRNLVFILDGARFVRLRVSIRDDQFDSYGGIVKSAAGDEVWRGAGRIVRSERGINAIEFRVDSSVLHLGQYALHLRGIPDQGEAETLEEYSFRAIRKRREG